MAAGWSELESHREAPRRSVASAHILGRPTLAAVAQAQERTGELLAVTVGKGGESGEAFEVIQGREGRSCLNVNLS